MTSRSFPRTSCSSSIRPDRWPGKKSSRAKGALRFCLNSLNEGDRFNIVNFSTEANAFREALADKSTESVAEALKFVDDLRARGGTNINDALVEALKMRFGQGASLHGP